MVRTTLLALLVLPFVGGCDLENVLSDAAEAAKEEAQTKAEKEQTKEDPPAVPASGGDACLAACDANTELSADDRATCRLNCEQAGPAKAASPQHDAVRAYQACTDACTQGKSKTDAATCELNCASKATAKLGEGEDNAAQQRSCATTCFEDMAACRTGCEAPGEKRTDQATCRIECENLAGRCVDSCKNAK